MAITFSHNFDRTLSIDLIRDALIHTNRIIRRTIPTIWLIFNSQLFFFVGCALSIYQRDDDDQ